MRRKSHHLLGKYLVHHYLKCVPKRYIHAFLLGCIQPDLNPVTYLKGSVRFQWLRGHNYPNCHNAMEKFSLRLEMRENYSIFDYYTLGKLIHYTADCFTKAHNPNFPKSIKYHRQYEEQLQNYFISYLYSQPSNQVCKPCSIMEVISLYHKEYTASGPNIYNDARHCHRSCCCIFSILFANVEISNESNSDYLQGSTHRSNPSCTNISASESLPIP